MGLLSFLKRRSDEGPATIAPGADAVDSVQQARIRARRRLIGAVVLVGAGIIGFPLLFETQPRPLSVNTPIEIARRDTGTTTTGRGGDKVLGPPHPGKPAASQGAAPEERVLDETAAQAEKEVIPAPEKVLPPADIQVPQPASAPSALPRAAVPPRPAASKAAAPAEKKPSPKPATEAQRTEPLSGSGEVASPKKPETAASDSGRFVVQVGAFGDMPAARGTRQKVEKLGMKSFIQEVETSAGKRIRVRVGPFTSRAEADKVAGRLKGQGLSPAVYAL